jgi:lysophospholipase L1-like esterase
MKKAIKILGVLLGLAVLGLSWPAWQLYEELQRARSEDPLVWEEAVSNLELNTRGLFAPGEAVVFIGSSSIRFWDTIAEDMAPIQVVQHGFGGAKLGDIVHYAGRLVSAYAPSAVVVFAGSNDIDPTASKSPEVLLARYQEFVRSIRAKQPAVPIFYIGITPSPLRWEVWPIAQSTNQLIQAWTATDPNLYFIDTSVGLLGQNGEPDRENYVYDGLHLSERGYAIWRDIIRQYLLQARPELAGSATASSPPLLQQKGQQ